jgi:hypothetical protein
MTFVVQEQPTGLWVMGCCDDLHGYQHEYSEHQTKAAAERAATAHRRRDAALREAWETRLVPRTCCPTCGGPVPRPPVERVIEWE